MGDRLHALLCAAGYNLRWLLRMIAKKGLRAVLWLLPVRLRSALLAVLHSGATPLRPAAALRLGTIS